MAYSTPSRRWIKSSNPRVFYPFPIHIKKGEVLELLGRWDEALAIYRGAMELAVRCADAACAAEGRLNYGWMLHKQGDQEQAMALLGQARDHYQGAGDTKKMAVALTRIGNVYFSHSEYAKAQECFETCLALATAENDRYDISRALVNVGNVYGDLGDRQRALECYRQSRDMDLAAGDRYNASLDTGNMGWAHYAGGDYPKAMECWSEQARWSEFFGDKHALGIALANMVSVYMGTGDLENSRKNIERRLKLAREMGDKKGLSVSLSHLANYQRFTGRLDESEESFSQAIRLARELGLKYFLAMFLQEQSELRYEAGMQAEAEEACREALALAEAIGKKDTAFTCRLLQAKIAAQADKEEGARRLTELETTAGSTGQQAALQYALFKLTGEAVPRERAVALYTELCARTPDVCYKKKLDELNRP